MKEGFFYTILRYLVRIQMRLQKYFGPIMYSLSFDVIVNGGGAFFVINLYLSWPDNTGALVELQDN